MADTQAISIDRLVVEYKGRRAVDGLTLNIPKGEIFGFLGPNGAGKSSTIKAMLGLLFPTSGCIRIHGFAPTDVRARSKIGFMPEETTYYRFLSPVEILTHYGRIFGIPKAELKKRIDRLMELVGLTPVGRRLISSFSKGMTQKMSLAQALINDPDVLILDEPTSGLDPLARMNLRQILSELKKQGKTIFFSSHELSEAETVCDSIAVIQAGRTLKSGSLAEVMGSRHAMSLEQFFLQTIQGPRS